ncbi:MAG: tyrosine-protein phosphatase [Phycisphaerae bacterium]|nr:tyrosine-protein phosphatase [Phycisphaerae bacterium]
MGCPTTSRGRLRQRGLRWTAAALVLLLLAGAGYYLVQRVWRGNFATVVEGQVYRSAQPTVHQIARWSRRYGLRTLVNLRGTVDEPAYAPQRAAAREAGLTVVDLRMTSDRMPSRRTIARLIEVLETAERPMLLHCADGADRTGLAGVLAAMAIGGRSYAEARDELTWRHFHFGADIAYFLDAYEQWCRRHDRPTAGWDQFRRWALEHYRTSYYYVQWHVAPRLSAEPGSRVSMSVGFVNRSGRTIPAGDPERRFTLAYFTGSSTNDQPDREFGPRMPLPPRDIPPDASVTLDCTFRAPVRPGTYEVHFDLVEEQETWFARQGSPMGTCVLEVAAPTSRPRERP